MEQSNGGLNLQITTADSFENDNIEDTIVSYGQNFLAIERHLMDTFNSPDEITTGQTIKQGKIVWNSNPEIGGYVGWVNTREGKHAPLWKPKEHYSVGQEVRPITDNGNIYVCITEGRSMGREPNFLVGNGAEFYDANGDIWYPNYNYNVNDVVFAVNGSKIFYYICETAGITDTNEPVWTSVPKGSTVIDGSVVWRKEATIRWRQYGVSTNFRPFGKIE